MISVPVDRRMADALLRECLKTTKMARTKKRTTRKRMKKKMKGIRNERDADSR
jgi:hypothetical protein